MAFLIEEVCPPLLKGGGHFVFGTDRVGVSLCVSVSVKLLVHSVT